MYNLRKFFVSILGLFVLGGCSTIPERPSEGIPIGDTDFLRDRIAWEIKNSIEADELAGVSIAVVDGDRIVWEEGFGFADQENGIKASAHTVYRVGAISKLFTSIATLQLAESGAVDVDAPLAEYLPGFQLNASPLDQAEGGSQEEEITLRSILTHRSGIPQDYFDRMFSDNPRDYQEYVDLLRSEFATSPPNTAYSYSNVAMTLLGHMVEEVSQEQFSERIQKQILDPVGMPSSSFELTASIRTQLAKAYAFGVEQKQLQISTVPAGSLYSSVHDLARFIQMCFKGGAGLHGRVLNENTIESMWSAQENPPDRDFDRKMGLGWHIEDRPVVGRIVGHSGSMMNFRSTILLLPAHEIGVVMLTNSREGYRAINTISHQALNLMLETKTGVRVPAQEGRARLNNSFSSRDLRELSGHVQTSMGVFYFENKENGLTGYSPGKTIELRPTENRTFSMHYRILDLFSFQPPSLAKTEYHFVRTADKNLLVSRNFGQDHLFGEKFRPSLIPESWKSRLGEYELIQSSSDADSFRNFRLEEFRGALVLIFDRVRGPGRMGLALDPVSDTHAIVLGVGRNQGQSVRASGGGKSEELTFAGLRLRKR
jgi:CubicO group peptidase (beta-lactamase class C family)